MDAKAYIRDRCTPNPAGCWLWSLSTNNGGYGRTKLPVLGERGAHRIAFRAFVGPIPADRDVLHRCDVPACVNPEHLWVGTKTDNMQDMAHKGRAGVKRGEANPQAKLSRVKVEAIRAKRASGCRVASIAREFGVSHSAVDLLLKGATWAAQGA